MSDHQQIVYKKHTFLSSVALGLSAVAIVCIICCTAVMIYGVHFAGAQSEKFMAITGDVFDGIPDIIQSLPPLAADVLNDQRLPSYSGEIEATARIIAADNHGQARTQIEVTNNGERLITMLSLRITILDANDEIVSESNEWAATPLAADHDWRGPLMPNSHRRFNSGSHRLPRDTDQAHLRAEVEITDIRVWAGPKVVDKDVSVATETGLNEI